MTVYVVFEGSYDDWEIVLVTKDRMRAESALKERIRKGTSRYSEEHEVE